MKLRPSHHIRLTISSFYDATLFLLNAVNLIGKKISRETQETKLLLPRGGGLKAKTTASDNYRGTLLSTNEML